MASLTYHRSRDKRPRHIRWAEQQFKKGYSLVIDHGTKPPSAYFRQQSRIGSLPCPYKTALTIKASLSHFADQIIERH